MGTINNSDELNPLEGTTFDNRSGSMAERAIFNNRVLILASFIVVTLILGYFSAGLKLSASFDKMLPQNHPFILNYLEHRDELTGLGNSVRVAVETQGESILDPEYLETLRQINDELFMMPEVERSHMKSLWTPSVRWTGVTEVGLDGGPVIPQSYDGGSDSLEQIRINIERSGILGQLVSDDYRSSVIEVPLLDGGDTKIDYEKLNNKLEDLRKRYEGQGVNIYITGFAKIIGDLIDGLQSVLLFFALAITICSLLLYGYTRCVRSTLLVVLCSVIAVLWLCGILKLLDLSLDPYSILVPFLVFAIGMSHAAQKMNGIMQDVGRGYDKLIAARFTFRRLFVAGFTALAADAVGFAVLMIIDIPVIRELAITASIGVAVLVFTNLVLLPVLLSYTGVSSRAAVRSLRAETGEKHPVWVFLDKFTAKPWASVAVIVGLVMGVSGLAVSVDLRIGDLDPGAPELRQDSRYNQDNQFIVENYSASSDLFVVMVTTPEYQCANYGTLVDVDALEWELRQVAGVERTESFASLSKKQFMGMNEGNTNWFDLPRSESILNAIVTRAPREFFNQKCNLLSLYVYLKDHKADTLTRVVETVEGFAQRNNTDDVQFLPAAGNAGIEAATNVVVKRANVQMLFLVYVAVMVLAFLTFRSWRAVVCAVLPLMLTSVLCEALMVALGIGVKVATLPVVALGVGIGVDYALYVLSVTLAGLKAGQTLSEAYYRALLFTGKVVVLTGITLGIAVSTWAFSPIKFQADMGILLAFMFVWNMVGALIFLPALGHFLLKPEKIRLGSNASDAPTIKVNEDAPSAQIQDRVASAALGSEQ
ncbi:RND family transporter [Marinobacter sp. GN3S48]|uniref:efflux RND transporter permease subunit n=1 Tax=Marinobacter sp. GN3S48 TaxID=3382302 RepID=UPI00387AF78A